MLDLAFPDVRQFSLSRNYHRALGLGLREFIRRERLIAAFPSKREWRSSLEAGEIWVLQGDALHAASSFVNLLRATGQQIPEMFDGVVPPLPRADYGLMLSFDASQTRPWRLEYLSEQRNDRVVMAGMTFRALLSRALELNLERAQSIALRFATMDTESGLLQVVH